MNGDIQGYGPQQDPMLPRDARRASRAMSRDRANGYIQRSRIEILTRTTLEAIGSSSRTTAAAMMDISLVAALQTQLELTTPAASDRLNRAAERHAAQLDDIQADHHHGLRRP